MVSQVVSPRLDWDVMRGTARPRYLATLLYTIHLDVSLGSLIFSQVSIFS